MKNIKIFVALMATLVFTIFSLPIAQAQTKKPATPPKVQFSVHAPKNVQIEYRVRETFPILNYVFFNIGSTEIQDCYVMLKKEQVKDFKEDQLEVFQPKRLSGRSNRQLTAYYNVLNILGDRLQKNPTTTINLVGSSEEGIEDGKKMAQSVKGYLIGIFGIESARITTEGRDKPKIRSGKTVATQEDKRITEGNRRVSIESSSPVLLMQFQSGSDAPLMPVEMVGVQEAPLKSYAVFTAKGAKAAYKEWSIEMRDESAKTQKFGPYTNETISIPGKSILGTRPEGNFTVTMIGKTKGGKIEKKYASMHLVLWTPPKNEEGMRYSIVFGFNDSKAMASNEKYLTDIVTPKIPKGGTLFIQGYTDNIGDEDSNQALSLARAEMVRDIIQAALTKADRTDVRIETYGYGEDETVSPFDNTYPEERFYNRTVIIDILQAN